MANVEPAFYHWDLMVPPKRRFFSQHDAFTEADVVCSSALDVEVQDEAWPAPMFQHGEGSLNWKTDRSPHLP